MRHLTTPAPYPILLPAIVRRMGLTLLIMHKEVQEDISAQVVCHVSVTFTCQNNSRLPLAPMSASSLCLSHAFVCGQRRKSTQKHYKASQVASVCECDSGAGAECGQFPLFG